MLLDIKTRIETACLRVGRKPEDIKLVAVTKGHSPKEIQTAILQYGHCVLGENRIQEWQQKTALAGVEWHFIGNLQRNKVKYCRPFYLIHSLNSSRLADELQAFGSKHGHVFRVLIEVNVAGEDTKQGVAITELEKLVTYTQSLSHVSLEGLMTIAPYSDTPDTARPYFAHLRQIRDRLGLKELSMGMSGDFEVAIEEGATIVRIGTALFR